jgi:drug/metabolite transporter (DMT)-like permease
MLWAMRGLAPFVGETAAPYAFLGWRFAIALVLQAAVFPGAVRALTPRAIAAGLLLSLPFNAGFLLQTVGLRFTTSTVSAFLTSLFVVLTPLLGRLFFRERLAPATLAGALVSLGGVWILTDPAGGLGRGEVLTLLCAVAFALQLQLTNLVTRKHPPEAVTLVMFASAVAVSAAGLTLLGTSPASLVRGLGGNRVWWTTLYAAAVCSVAAFWALNRFQRDITPTRAAVIYMLEPVVAALLAVLLEGEPMTPRKLLGGAVIVGGNLLCEMMGAKTKTA